MTYLQALQMLLSYPNLSYFYQVIDDKGRFLFGQFQEFYTVL